MTVKKYSIDSVRALRSHRKTLTSNGSSPIIKTDTDYQSFLGELKGAGHLMVNGFRKLKKQNHPSFNSNGGFTTEYELSFEVPTSIQGDKPHFSGYVQSASNADKKPYKVNAWLNEHGSIRIEIIEK